MQHSILGLYLSLVPYQLRDDVIRMNKTPSVDIGNSYRKMASNVKESTNLGGFRNYIMLALLLNHNDVFVELEQTDSLGSTFAGCVKDATSLCPLSGKYFYHNLTLYLLLSIRYPYPTMATFVAANTIPKEHLILDILSEEGVSYNAFYTDTLRLIELFRNEMLDFASSDSGLFTKAVLNTLVTIYKVVLRIEIETINKDALIGERFAYMLSSVPESIQYRLLLLSYLESGKRAFKHIDSISMPRTYLITDLKRYGDKVPFSFMSFVCERYLLKDKRVVSSLIEGENAPISFLHFYRIVYQLEQIHLYKELYPILNALKGFYIEDFMETIPQPKKERDILLQYLCMQTPNWIELWYKMGWSMYPGLIRRLHFFYHSDFNRSSDALFTMKVVLS